MKAPATQIPGRSRAAHCWLYPATSLIHGLTVTLLSCGFASAGIGANSQQALIFTIHGTLKTCSAITQLDNALSSGYQAFFAEWTEKDYGDAIAWAQACSSYGWHVPGRPRIALIHSQHDMVFPSASTHAPRLLWSTRYELPTDGSAFIGFDATVTSHYKDTLPEIARRYGLGYEEIHRANPGIDIWLPGEGTRILLPGRHRLPPGLREGLVINVAERRMFFFPTRGKSEKPSVISYPVSIGKSGEQTPLGQTVIIAKAAHPYWHPPAAVRKEHADRGEWLPVAIAPGADNPLGEFMMRLGFGEGTYEIHGTNKPVSVGMDSTDGCIGLYPEDMAALFASVEVGTTVRLVNVTVANDDAVLVKKR